jgi:hypothetical protein
VTLSRPACVLFAIPILAALLAAQEPSDLRVQLRSATGSNRFQIGEVIPLEVVLSSTTPNRYLEPCAIFRETNFGFPQCRFFTHWSFTITSGDGWVDLTKEFPSGPGTGGGPTFEVPSHDLSSQPKTFPYTLTHRFRFDKPGEYRVQLSMEVGLDDETTQRKLVLDPNVKDPAVKNSAIKDPAVKPHSVTVTPDIVLQIVAAPPEWQQEVVRKGYEAYSKPVARNSDPPSAEFLQYQRATEALCYLGTPEAARTLVGLLTSPERQEIQRCLDHTPNADAAIKEMQRLLVDPDVAVTPALFAQLVKLLAGGRFWGAYEITKQATDREREVLLSVLPQKHGEAQVTSLLTLLQWPPRAEGTPTTTDEGYDLPFAPSVIAAVVAHYDSFPHDKQQWLLGDAWARVRSPLMLPLLRCLAEDGNGPALLRWMELDQPAATDFARKEVVRPVPRFSSFYLRLPDPSLPGQEAQIAANFVTLTRDQDLLNGATLLHRYATRAELLAVLPFIDAKLAAWPCAVQFAALDYLLKVSPSDATPRVEKALRESNHDPCNTNTFLTNVGYLEPSPVLERLAIAQIDTVTNNSRDAADYLRQHGSAAAKPIVWTQLVHWHKQFVDSGAEKRIRQGPPANDDYALYTLDTALTQAYTSALGWVLSPEEADRVQAVLGDRTASGLSCRFHCGAPLAIAPTPANYFIYGRANPSWERNEIEFLNPVERLNYSINQYHCRDIHALKEKILQFPKGSSFDFAYDFTAADRDELIEINDFLWKQGYKAGNPQNWSFLRPGPPR